MFENGSLKSRQGQTLEPVQEPRFREVLKDFMLHRHSWRGDAQLPWPSWCPDNVNIIFFLSETKIHACYNILHACGYVFVYIYVFAYYSKGQIKHKFRPYAPSGSPFTTSTLRNKLGLPFFSLKPWPWKRSRYIFRPRKQKTLKPFH